MKLAVVGVVTVILGVALPAPGLVGVGAFWVVMGMIARSIAPRLVIRATKDQAPDGRRLWPGLLLLLAVGVPSLVVGILEIGFDDDVATWRWLPLAVGMVTAGLAVLSGLMYSAGAGLAAVTGATGGTIPATVWIRSMKETGQFINERPRLAFVLRVQPDAGSGVVEYDATKRATVPYTALAYLRIGDGFRATVSGPDDPDAMTIDWDSPVSATT